MDKTIIAFFKTIRPRQWLKNVTLFAGIIFSGRLFHTQDFATVSIAFVLFSFAASAVYIFNDLLDAPKDRLHPFKAKRPIASGVFPARLAIFSAILLLFLSMALGIMLSQRFFLAILAYLFLQVLYMSYFKHIIILDVLTIASGFLLRIYAGVWVIGTHLNIWFLLSVISFALFIAVGKRRAELTLLTGYDKKTDLTHVRATLSHYPEALLHSYTTMFATATWLTYSLFTFNQPSITPNREYFYFVYDLLPRASDTKWLMVTIPVVIFAVMRYLYLIYERKEGESPERILLADKPLLSSVTLWGILVLLVLYGFSG